MGLMGDGLKDELRFRLRRRKLGVTQSLTSLSATGLSPPGKRWEGGSGARLLAAGRGADSRLIADPGRVGVQLPWRRRPPLVGPYYLPRYLNG